ncbi:MAG: adenylate kinase [Rectinema sp.]
MYIENMNIQSMKLIFLGPPGAGKGTISKMVGERLGVPQISTGDMFRAAVKEKTELGLKVQSILAAGGLVPDELTIAIVKERLSWPDVRQSYILDGFPRTIPQAEALAAFSSLDAAVDFEVRDDLILFRLTGRRVCKTCGAIYHAVTKPPKAEGICDLCGGELYTRNDDKEETVKARLSAYHEETEPLIGYYTKKGLLLTIDGSPDAETVYNTFISEIGRFLKK